MEQSDAPSECVERVSPAGSLTCVHPEQKYGAGQNSGPVLPRPPVAVALFFLNSVQPVWFIQNLQHVSNGKGNKFGRRVRWRL